jgi:plastocyanin
MKPATLSFVTAVFLIVVASACAAVLATTLQLKASGSIAYNKKTLSAPAGKVTIRMTNGSPLKHDVAIKGNGVKAKGKIVPTGGASVVTANLKAGRYTFYCTVPGHEAAGMKGVLTVR